MFQPFTKNNKWRHCWHYWRVVRVSSGFGENSSPKSTSWSQWRKNVQVNVSDVSNVFIKNVCQLQFFFICVDENFYFYYSIFNHQQVDLL